MATEAMYGIRRAPRLFQDHMKQVLCEAVYVALKVCQQVHDPRDDFMAEGEPKALDCLDEVLQAWFQSRCEAESDQEQRSTASV